MEHHKGAASKVLKADRLGAFTSYMGGKCALLVFLKKLYERKIKVKKVAIVMGSDSDVPVVSKAAQVLKELGISYEAHVYSAHRTPYEAAIFARNAKEKGFGVIIAAAGMAAHLAGAMAANTLLPVIGIPCVSGALSGLDALLSTVMMPPGIPVASVGTDAGKNAGLLAAEIIALGDEELYEKLVKLREKEADKVIEKDKKLSL